MRVNEPERRILKLIEESVHSLTPSEISKKLGINDSSTRVYLMQLKAKGLVRSPYRGHYTSIKSLVTPEGVGLGVAGAVVPRCHKLMLVVSGAVGFGVGRRVLVDNVLFRVVAVGYDGGTVNVFVDCKGDYSFDYAAFRLLVELLKRELGVAEESFEVRSFELNVDVKGVQLDGVKGLTLKAFDGSFARLYQKSQGLLRKEVNIQKPLPLESAYALLSGGVGAYNVMQSSLLVAEKVDGLVKAQKAGNEIQVRIHGLLQELLKRLPLER